MAEPHQTMPWHLAGAIHSRASHADGRPWPLRVQRRSARAPFWERSAFAIESGVVAVARGVALVVGMDAQVTSQLVTAAEAFVTAWMRACMRLFTRVRSNVARLVLQPIEGSSA